jgi:hypothetical protein
MIVSRLIVFVGNVSRLLSVVSCDYIFKYLDDLSDSCILFLYLAQLLNFYSAINGQRATISGHYLFVNTNDKMLYQHLACFRESNGGLQNNEISL